MYSIARTNSNCAAHKDVFILFSRRSSRIALDVLHPCTYLWVEKSKLKPEKAAKLTWSQALVNGGWWALQFNNLILNETVTGLMKWLGPAWFVLMPFLTLFMPYIGVNQAFMMIGSTTNRWEAEAVKRNETNDSLPSDVLIDVCEWCVMFFFNFNAFGIYGEATRLTDSHSLARKNRASLWWNGKM